MVALDAMSAETFVASPSITDIVSQIWQVK